MSITVVDVQGFITSNKTFTPKELAVYNGSSVSHYVFKPPFAFHNLHPSFAKQARWLMDNHHCINWEEGFTPHFMFPNIIKRLTQEANAVYVKGKEKADYIRRLISKPVIEFEEQPILTAIAPLCFYHLKSPCICALSNVYHLYSTHVMQ